MNNSIECLSIPKTNKSYTVVDKYKLISNLNKEIFGQEKNIEKLAHLVCNHLAAKEKNRPLSVFLYGPSGVCKAAIINLLTKEINKQNNSSCRYAYRSIDCCQLQNSSDISRLIGAAPGYVEFDEPGLFSILESNPNTIFVFEGIERFGSDITKVIMKIIETGHQKLNGKTLINGGNFYDFSNCIFFFTSNIVVEEKNTMKFANSCHSFNQKNFIKEADLASLINQETKRAKPKLAETGKIKAEFIDKMDAIIRFSPPR